MEDLITNDQSRCRNYQCPTNFCCSRFKQLILDRKKDETFSVTKFDGDKVKGLCLYFINADVEFLKGINQDGK